MFVWHTEFTSNTNPPQTKLHSEHLKLLQLHPSACSTEQNPIGTACTRELMALVRIWVPCPGFGTGFGHLRITARLGPDRLQPLLSRAAAQSPARAAGSAGMGSTALPRRQKIGNAVLLTSTLHLPSFSLKPLPPSRSVRCREPRSCEWIYRS